MDEQRLQFRVGLFVLVALTISGWLIVRFSDLRHMWEETYALAIQFDRAPGVLPGTPVRLNGIRIGRTRHVVLDPAEPGVVVVVDIDGRFQLRLDSQPTISRSLLGDSAIEFSAGSSPEVLPPQTKLRGRLPEDPLETMYRLEAQVTRTLAAFESTTHEWQTVARNVNNLMETERGHLAEVIAKTAQALDDFADTMQAAREMVAHTNELVADPVLREKLHATLQSLPDLVEETRQTIAAARSTVQRTSESLDKINTNLDQVQRATAPLADGSQRLVARLDGGLLQLENLLGELHQFAALLNERDGTLQKFVSDPRLYENLARSSSSLTLLLENLEPTLRDMRIFADKVARHPELLGVSGAISGSSGLKEVNGTDRQAGRAMPPPR